MDINKLYLSFDKYGNAYLAVPELDNIEHSQEDIYNYLSTLEIEFSNDKYHKLDNRYLHDIVWNDDGAEDNNVIKNRTHWKETKLVPMYNDGLDEMSNALGGAVYALYYAIDEDLQYNEFDKPEYVKITHENGDTNIINVYDSEALGDFYYDSIIDTIAQENNGIFGVYYGNDLDVYIVTRHLNNDVNVYNFKVEIPQYEYHQLDPRYLPDTTKYYQLHVGNGPYESGFKSLIGLGLRTDFVNVFPEAPIIFCPISESDMLFPAYANAWKCAFLSALKNNCRIIISYIDQYGNNRSSWFDYNESELVVNGANVTIKPGKSLKISNGDHIYFIIIDQEGFELSGIPLIYNPNNINITSVKLSLENQGIVEIPFIPESAIWNSYAITTLYDGVLNIYEQLDGLQELLESI